MIQGTIEQIGPKEADQYLLKHEFNRPLRRGHVISLARQMSQNLWQVTGEPIIIDEDGYLQDGQHRLRAIIHSGTTQQFFVVRGTVKEAFLVMDTGKKRDYKDALYIAGFAQPLHYGGLASKALRWERMIFFGSAREAAMAPSNAEIVEYCEEHRKELAETVNYYMQVQKSLRGIMGGGTFMFGYYMCKKKNKAQAFDFFERLATGQGIGDHPKYQPVQVLRTRLIQNRTDDAKLSTRMITLMIFGAWNAYRKNKKLNSLSGQIDLIAAKGKKIEIY